MNIEKTKLGLPFFDQAVGGIYFNLPALIRGRRDCGKAILAAHFVDKILRTGEKVVVFCEKPPETVLLDARAAGFDFETPARSRQLTLIPLREVLDSAPDGRFPYDTAVEELHALVSRNSIGFAVFNSVVPWLEVYPVDDIPRRVSSFIEAVSSLSLTSLLLLHKPASEPAETVAAALVEGCPIVLEMDAFHYNQRELRIVKYHGQNDLQLPVVFPLELVSGKGLQPIGASAPAPLPDFSTSAPAANPTGGRTPLRLEPHHPRHTLFTGVHQQSALPVSSRVQPAGGAANAAPLPAAGAATGRSAAPAAPTRRQTLFTGGPQVPPPATSVAGGRSAASPVPPAPPAPVSPVPPAPSAPVPSAPPVSPAPPVTPAPPVSPVPPAGGAGGDAPRPSPESAPASGSAPRSSHIRFSSVIR